MNPTLLVHIIVAVGSSLAASVEKPKQAGAGGEAAFQGDDLTPLGVADAAKAVESEEVSLLASVSIHHFMYYITRQQYIAWKTKNRLRQDSVKNTTRGD